MKHTRRRFLRKASVLSALAVGTTAAAHCDAPEWDSSATYSGGDEVIYDGALWTAE